MIYCAGTRVGDSACCRVGGDSWVCTARRDSFRGRVPCARSDRFDSVVQHSVGGCTHPVGLHLWQEDGAKLKVAESENKRKKRETAHETKQRFHTVGGNHAALI
jgi:hypothetical protein